MADEAMSVSTQYSCQMHPVNSGKEMWKFDFAHIFQTDYDYEKKFLSSNEMYFFLIT